MLVLDLTTGEVIRPEDDQPTAKPHDMFQAERDRLCAELQTVRPEAHDSEKPNPVIIQSALSWLEHNG